MTFLSTGGDRQHGNAIAFLLESIEPLSGSLDSADSAGSIARLPQVHFAGANDRVVPPAVAEAFVRHLPTPNSARVIVEPGFNHECCWAAAWPPMLGQLGASGDVGAPHRLTERRIAFSRVAP